MPSALCLKCKTLAMVPGRFFQQPCAQRRLFLPAYRNCWQVLLSPPNAFPASRDKLTSDSGPFISFVFLSPTGKLTSFQVGSVRKMLASDSDKALAGAGIEVCVLLAE